jgi:hypothetical protein
MSKNERITENLVRSFLEAAGYNIDKEIIIEEQKSVSPQIDKLLKGASKQGSGKGFPEFIIRSKSYGDLIIVVECKADRKKHQSKELNKYEEYAVDGSLLYASYLSKEFDVLAIGVSGQNKKEILISHNIYLKNAKKYSSYFGNEILPFQDYVDGILKSEIKFNWDYSKLLDYTRDLNELLHLKKVKEAQRSLLISGILIALQNRVFKQGYKLHKKAEQLASSLLETIVNEFTNANLVRNKVDNLKNAFSFLLTHTTLNTDKEFFENLIFNINKNVNNFIQTHKYFDTLGQFYIEFLRYANTDKGLGIVLTPPHITDLCVELAEIDKDSIVFDNCAGTGGFLISAMKKMVVESNNNSSKILKIRNSQLVGIEYQDDIYALCISNLIIHGDGKTNILLGDCFSLSDKVKKEFQPTAGLLNPPYKTKTEDIEEIEFILDNLNALRTGSKCVAVIPMSCAISLNANILELKKRILEKHTLEAVMSMPEDLFHNSKVGHTTCIIVITANKPHPKGKKTWLGYWRNDGFEKLKSKGRVDVNNNWSNIKDKWLQSYFNKEVIPGYSFLKELTLEDEWCVEAYLLADYNKIDSNYYKKFVQKYLAFRLLNDLVHLNTKKQNKNLKEKIELVPLTELFNPYNGLASSQVTIKEDQESHDDIRYIRPSHTYQGSIDGYVDRKFIDNKFIYPENTIYVSTDGQGSHTYSYVSSFDFIPNSNVSVLIPKKEMCLEEKLYYAICISLNRFKFSYGRKPKGDRLNNIFIPSYCPPFVYGKVFEEIIENWKKIIN